MKLLRRTLFIRLVPWMTLLNVRVVVELVIGARGVAPRAGGVRGRAEGALRPEVAVLEDGGDGPGLRNRKRRVRPGRVEVVRGRRARKFFVGLELPDPAFEGRLDLDEFVLEAGDGVLHVLLLVLVVDLVLLEFGLE